MKVYRRESMYAKRIISLYSDEIFFSNVILFSKLTPLFLHNVSGISASFAVKMFKAWIAEKDASSVTSSLRKANLDKRLLVRPNKTQLQVWNDFLLSSENRSERNHEQDGTQSISTQRVSMESVFTCYLCA